MSGELAGLLRNRVAIERRAATRDAIGAASGAWTPIGHAWVRLAADGTGEAVVGDARSMAPRWQVTLRADGDVRVGDRLVWRGRRLRVRRRIEDPETPDRVVVDAEEER